MRKICSIHYLDFSFEKHVHFQVLKDFSVENLETTPSIFLSIFFREIYLSRIINYWVSVFTSYLTWWAFSLVCVLSVFFLYLFFFLSVFSWIDTNDSQDSRAGRRNHYFCFLLPLANKHLFISSRFLSFLLTQSLCNYQANSWWDLFTFLSSYETIILLLKNEHLYTLSHHCLSIQPTQPYPLPPFILYLFAKMY